MGILKIGVVGCGRIGKLHINNLINSVPGVQVVAAADPMLDKSGAREWLAERKITNVSTDFMDVINNPEVDVVFVCSIDYDIDKIKKLLALVEEKGVKFQVGFNRRFDHNHKAVADAVKDGTIGDPHIVIVSSRDPVEISAVGSCLVNPNLQEESGIPDVDTAVVTMKMANGCIAVINNSRQAVYGYDQRVEAFGSKGMASDANDLLNTTTVLTKDGAHSEKPLWFFLERYNQAFINQVISFVDAINNDTQTVVGAIDGLRPVLMAKAATESCRNGGVYVKVEE
nr:Gfo/Idh/MocA family oxidoreductase [Butyricicoccus sp. AF05-36]